MARKKDFPDELIGEEVEIVHSTNPSALGIVGGIIDETKQTLTVRRNDNGREVVLLKNTITFKLSRTGVTVAGKDIMKRPEERVKG